MADQDTTDFGGRIVATKIDDGRRVRNETNLKLVGRLWFFTDGSMYVYYEPTHWAEIASPAERRVP